ncbi:glucoamylase family protein [Pontibacter liquoris]|uniref:glucoamylase family protein n=1 Tax=Pontibacter liquoris TaxID=2905677 RepID=UPI001FA798B0
MDEDKALLDEVQQATLGYFWEYAHPTSGMARERTGSGDVVTTGGTGFGVQAIIVGVNRGWISRTEAVARLTKLTTFLASADRFHGAWPHWINGNSGRVIPFGTKDNGGDLVETAYLINGLLTARAYFNGAGAEAELRDKIAQLWESVEWDWYASRGDGLLYWHWSPTYTWKMNMPIRGWNEALNTYILALSSPTHPITAATYQNTWIGQNFGAAQQYGGYTLKMGPNFGGPLFFAHYSFLSLDPKQLEDSYTSYWLQNINHTMANRSYCLYFAPKAYGYSDNYWGLTASDDPDGYRAHAPGNDNGTISPTAALSSFPYTPYYSMQALRYFYGSLKNQLAGTYGLKNAHNKARNWVATDHLAIDQGPIVVMIENYRSGLLWGLFTELPEIYAGLVKAGMHQPTYATGFPLAVPDMQKGWTDLLRHPDRDAYQVAVATSEGGSYTLELIKVDGALAEIIWDKQVQPNGLQQVEFGKEVIPGKYKLVLSTAAVAKELVVYLH